MEEQRFGLMAEQWARALLEEAGYKVRPGSLFEDHSLKIDFWVLDPARKYWLPVQFTVDRKAAVSGKGIDVLHKGVLISWLSGEELEAWAKGCERIRRQKELIAQFWRQIEALLRAWGARLQETWSQRWWREIAPSVPQEGLAGKAGRGM